MSEIRGVFINSNNQIRCGWKITIALILQFVIMFLFGVIIGLAYEIAKITLSDQVIESIRLSTNESLIQTALMLIQEIIPIIVCISLWKLIDKKSLGEMGITSFKDNWKKFFWGLIMGALLLTLVAVILILISSVKIKGGLNEPKFSLQTIRFLLIYIAVGFSEEILCRGYCLSVFKQCRSKYVPYIGSSIIFALLHSFNSGISLLAYINLFLFGFFLAYVVYITKNLWFGIGVHITWNFFEGNVFGFLVSGGSFEGSIYTLQNNSYNLINGGAFGPEGGVVVTAILILAILIFMGYNKKNNFEMVQKISE